MKKNRLGLVLLLLTPLGTGCENAATSPGQGQTGYKITFGRYSSRAIYTKGSGPQAKHPVIILVPGTGPRGPESVEPAEFTVNNQPCSFLSEIAKPFQQAGFNTFAIGKPGVDYASNPSIYYNQSLFDGLVWADQVNNLSDAVSYVRTLSTTDTTKIYVLGHSEGTQVVVDYAHTDSNLKGVFLLGYAGEDTATILDWQLFHRPFELWFEPDVDTDDDNIISKAEGDLWPEIAATWPAGVSQVSLADVHTQYQTAYQPLYDQMAASPLYSGGIFHRGPLYSLTASLPQDLYVYTGQLDVQTPPSYATQLQAACVTAGKSNVSVNLVPGLGHGFAPPRPPRAHPYLDRTRGPVDAGFLQTLRNLAMTL